MRKIRIGLISVSMFAMILGFQNCARPDVAATAPAPSTTNSSVTSEQISSLKESIQSVSQSDISCSQDSDCTLIALPELPGCAPQGYWVTSANNSEIQNLQSMVSQLAQVENDLASQGAVFACEYIYPPTPSCKQNVCTPTYPNIANN